MKRDWIVDVGIFLFSVVVFLLSLRAHLSENIVVGTGCGALFMAARLGFSLGKYFYLGLQISDKDLKDNTLFSVDRILFDDHLLMHEVRKGKHFKGKMVQFTDGREFRNIKKIFEEKGSAFLVKKYPNGGLKKDCSWHVSVSEITQGVFFQSDGKGYFVKELL